MVITALFVLLSCSLWAQDGKPLELLVQDKPASFVNKQFKAKKVYLSRIQLDKSLQQLLLGLYNEGYLSASIDSVEDLPDKYVAWLFVGEQYNWISLRAGNVNPEILGQVNFKERFYAGRTVRVSELEGLLENILTYIENNGYPFASIKLDSLALMDNGISAALNLDLKELIEYDTLRIEGDARISKRYLYNYLGFRPGKPYNEQDIQRASRRINKLPFLNEAKPLTVNFVAGKALVTLYLADNKASQFDFLLGILPNNAITGRILITGEANLQLINPFGTGKEIGLNWKRLQVGTQSLNVRFNYPYLFSLPLGADANFNLYKRDSLYLDLDYKLGVEYLFIGKNYLRAFVHNELTNVLNVDTTLIKSTRKLLAYNDVRNTLYGLEYNFQQLDDLFNPRDGFQVQATVGIGTRKIRENNTIAGLADPENTGQTFQFLYDSMKLKRVQYRFLLDLKHFLPLKKRSTLQTRINMGAYVSDEIFQNEQFRIGGTKILRGFDEESIFASLYVVGTLEYRFLLTKASFLSLFFDGAYVETRTLGSYSNDWPFGFGAGLNFATKAGMFGVSYALGRQQQNKLDLRSAKIHFGYFNYF